MNFFWSDTHFHHVNILRYCSRPYKDVDEMNRHMLDTIRMVPESSVLWLLGDICMKGKAQAEEIAQELAKMPAKIKIIGGNHDKGRTEIYKKYGLLEHATGRHLYKIDGLSVSMGHYPMTEAEFASQDITHINLNGHVHSEWKFQSVSPYSSNINCNVGVDVWPKPVTLEEICKARAEYHTSLFNK